MKLSVGSRLRSQACEAEIIVIKAPPEDIDLTCGGVPMVPAGPGPTDRLALVAGLDTGAQLGKRFIRKDDALEVLVTRAGAGTLAVDGVPLVAKASKPLPASD